MFVRKMGIVAGMFASPYPVQRPRTPFTPWGRAWTNDRPAIFFDNIIVLLFLYE
jgi:hypothetical protein